MLTLVTSRQFNQDTAAVKRSAQEGPVFVTNRGEPEFVFMTVREFHRLSQSGKTLYDLAVQEESDDDYDDGDPAPMNLILRTVEE